MNGPQDVGGGQGFGPIGPETDEPVFHAAWEERVFAVTLAMGATGAWSIDRSRLARESLAPSQYYASSYYQIWLAGLESLLAEQGLVSRAEIDAGRAIDAPVRLGRRLAAADVDAAMARGGPVSRPQTDSRPRFALGERVRARRINPSGHTRLPRYVRGCEGIIERIHGRHVFPDTHAAGKGEQPCWLYSVRFRARDLWGSDTTADSVSVDCWEPYLER